MNAGSSCSSPQYSASNASAPGVSVALVGRLRRAARAAVGRMGAVLQLWARRWRTRRQLRFLDERALRDIGVTPAAARRESHKWFWRA